MRRDVTAISLHQLLRMLWAVKYSVLTRPYELNIVGIRANSAVPNRFDDAIHLFYKDDSKKWFHQAFKATTDPGTFWLNNPIQTQGTAILKMGQYVNTYAIDMHRGKYMAICQRHKPVTIYRDYNRDSTLDIFQAEEQTGFFGINIHRANQSGETKTVDRFSAGCQVFSFSKDFYFMMSLAHKHREKYGNYFTYSLIDLRAINRDKNKANAIVLSLGAAFAAGLGVFLFNQ
jgi:hypothetical protein